MRDHTELQKLVVGFAIPVLDLDCLPEQEEFRGCMHVAECVLLTQYYQLLLTLMEHPTAAISH